MYSRDYYRGLDDEVFFEKAKEVSVPDAELYAACLERVEKLIAKREALITALDEAKANDPEWDPYNDYSEYYD